MNILTRPSRKATPSQPVSADVRLQAHFLERLARLQGMREELAETLDSQAQRLLDHALYSTYWDCVRLGNKDDAQRLLQLTRPISL
jgi:hypothetical protein